MQPHGVATYKAMKYKPSLESMSAKELCLFATYNGTVCVSTVLVPDENYYYYLY